MTVAERFGFVEESASLYEKHTTGDSWKADHELAMVCFAFAEVVAEGHSVYERICQLDNDLRLYFLNGVIEYDVAYEKRIGGLYAYWLTTSEGVLKIYDIIKSEYADRGFDGTPVENLLKNCREIRGAMSDDRHFFAQEATSSLATSAVEMHNTGDTVDASQVFGEGPQT